MRLWSIHPKFLDRIGLIALWRETLLAKKVLLGETKGYLNHPQLERFKNSQNPILAINTYLFYIYEEAKNRRYKFDFDKVGNVDLNIKINVTKGQLNYEFKHLLKKLKIRNIDQYNKISNFKCILPHPIFSLVPGAIESWEKTL